MTDKRFEGANLAGISTTLAEITNEDLRVRVGSEPDLETHDDIMTTLADLQYSIDYGGSREDFYRALENALSASSANPFYPNINFPAEYNDRTQPSLGNPLGRAFYRVGHDSAAPVGNLEQITDELSALCARYDMTTGVQIPGIAIYVHLTSAMINGLMDRPRRTPESEDLVSYLYNDLCERIEKYLGWRFNYYSRRERFNDSTQKLSGGHFGGESDHIRSRLQNGNDPKSYTRELVWKYYLDIRDSRDKHIRANLNR